MTRDPITISYKEMVTRALTLMKKNRKKAISILPVISEERKIIGILKLHDILQAGIYFNYPKIKWILNRNI